MIAPGIRHLIPAPVRAPLRRAWGRLPFGWRMSRAFRATSRLLERSQWWSEERIRAYQVGRLRQIIAHAQQHVPAYRERLAAAGIIPESLRSLEALQGLAFLTKEDLRQDPQRYLATNIPRRRLQLVTSGGTTGTPTGFYHVARYNDDVAMAFRLAMWKRIGYTPTRPALDVTAAFDDGPIHHDRNRNTLYLSITALDSRRLGSWVEVIRAHRPEFLIGFPSTVTLFAQLARDGGIAGLPIRGMITASEVLYEAQRRYLSAVFGCRILEWYGLAEYAGFASGCEYDDAYHVFPECGILELVDEQGRWVMEEGQEGEIVLTGFYNWATPFLRYRTGDRAVWGGRRCRQCGRNYPLLRTITGRTQEFLVARDGRVIPHTALNVHSDLFEHAWSYQLYQDTPGKVLLEIVKKPSYEDRQTPRIARMMQERLGGDVELSIQFVEEIPRTPRGKHRLIVQRLPRPQSDGLAGPPGPSPSGEGA